MNHFCDTAHPFDPSLLYVAVMGWFFPRRCPFCGQVIGSLAECTDAMCKQEQTDVQLHSKRLDMQMHYLGELAGAAAVFSYEGVVREAIHAMKYRGYRAFARDFGNLMAHELFGCTFTRKYGILITARDALQIADYHLIIPVPPSSKERGYNVPTLLAHVLSRALHVPLRVDVLYKIRATKQQAGLTWEERIANIAGAFAVTEGVDLQGKRILLVDDVITTGATVSACTQALRKAGADEVFAVSIARTMKPTEQEEC